MTYSDTAPTDLPNDRPAANLPFDWRWMLALGVLMSLGGLAAFAFPFLASLTVTALAGATFLLAGIMQLWMVFAHTQDSWAMRAAHAGLALALGLLGIVLLANPFAGMVSLTLTVGILFLVFGVLRAAIAIQMRDREGWGWALASAIVSIFLGVIVVLTLPASAATLLGVILAVDLVVSGAVAIVLGLRGRRAQA